MARLEPFKGCWPDGCLGRFGAPRGGRAARRRGAAFARLEPRPRSPPARPATSPLPPPEHPPTLPPPPPHPGRRGQQRAAGRLLLAAQRVGPTAGCAGGGQGAVFFCRGGGFSFAGAGAVSFCRGGRFWGGGARVHGVCGEEGFWGLPASSWSYWLCSGLFKTPFVRTARALSAAALSTPPRNPQHPPPGSHPPYPPDQQADGHRAQPAGVPGSRVRRPPGAGHGRRGAARGSGLPARPAQARPLALSCLALFEFETARFDWVGRDGHAFSAPVGVHLLPHVTPSGSQSPVKAQSALGPSPVKAPSNARAQTRYPPTPGGGSCRRCPGAARPTARSCSRCAPAPCVFR